MRRVGSSSRLPLDQRSAVPPTCTPYDTVCLVRSCHPNRTVRRHQRRAATGDRGRSKRRPVVVLAHGFPELAYSWRHQIPVLAAAGYHVLAPDQRGYGGRRPGRGHRLRHPRAHRPTSSGCSTRRRRPARCRSDTTGAPRWCGTPRSCTRTGWPAVAGLSVPPIPRPQVAPTAAFRRASGTTSTCCSSSSPGVADAELGADCPPRRMRAAVGRARRRPAPPLPDWISADGARPLRRRVRAGPASPAG